MYRYAVHFLRGNLSDLSLVVVVVVAEGKKAPLNYSIVLALVSHIPAVFRWKRVASARSRGWNPC